MVHNVGLRDHSSLNEQVQSLDYTKFLEKEAMNTNLDSWHGHHVSHLFNIA